MREAGNPWSKYQQIWLLVRASWPVGSRLLTVTSPALSSVCTWRMRERFLVFLPLLTRTPMLLDQPPPPPTSFHLNYLPKGSIPKSSHMRVRAWTRIWGGGGYNLVIAARVYFKLVLKVLLEQYNAFLSYLCTFYVIHFCSLWEGSSVSSDFHDRNPHA